MTYSPPTRCPRCRGRVVQTWPGEIPKCLDCGWEDYSRPLRSVSVGIQPTFPISTLQGLPQSATAIPDVGE